MTGCADDSKFVVPSHRATVDMRRDMELSIALTPSHYRCIILTN